MIELSEKDREYLNEGGAILRLMSNGMHQIEAGTELGFAKSTAQDRVNRVKSFYKARTTPHLMVILAKKGFF